jgi:hypothetical protein
MGRFRYAKLNAMGLASMLGICVASLPVAAVARSGNTSKAEVVRRLRPVLDEAKVAARIYYRGRCNAPDFKPYVVQHLPFPELNTSNPLSLHRSLAAVRDIFRDDKNVVVRKSGKKIVTIEIGSPSIAILKTRISIVEFSREEQYDPEFAIGALLHSKEVGLAMDRLGMRPIVSFEDRISGYPREDAPHISSSLRDVTLDEALDTIATTFNGIVMYGACAEPRLFDVEFYLVHPDVSQ